MLEIITFTILISTISNLLLRQIGIPTIIGYIATGNSYKLHHICEVINIITNNTRTIVKVNK